MWLKSDNGNWKPRSIASSKPPRLFPHSLVPPPLTTTTFTRSNNPRQSLFTTTATPTSTRSTFRQSQTSDTTPLTLLTGVQRQLHVRSPPPLSPTKRRTIIDSIRSSDIQTFSDIIDASTGAVPVPPKRSRSSTGSSGSAAAAERVQGELGRTRKVLDREAEAVERAAVSSTASTAFGSPTGSEPRSSFEEIQQLYSILERELHSAPVEDDR